MSNEEWIEIRGNNIDSAAGHILHVLEETLKGKREGNVIHFYGWLGLGASAALKVVAKHLKSSAAGKTDDPRSKLFDKVIHVDCSVWKSRRALQKVVAEELELPQSVMDIFDRHDEDDDFNGVDQGSRGEIPQVRGEIFTNLAGCRFVVVFHNGSKSYIDLDRCGIPVYSYLHNMLLWTYGGRFRPKGYTDPEHSVKLMGSTDTFLFGRVREMNGIDKSMLWYLVHEEAKEIVEYTGMPKSIDHTMVEECILYMWPLQAMRRRVDWETHASNYWVCDEIIQGDRSAWDVGDALQSYVHLDFNWEYMDLVVSFLATHLQHDVPRQPPICQSSSSEITSVPPRATSFFMEGDDKADAILPVGMFQHSDNSKLRVLHISCCTFSFASPPFLCCRNLRFLLLHHCKDDTSITEEKDQSHSQISESWKACFGKLWVLDLNYTELYRLLSVEMIKVMADLRELNVKGLKQWHITDLRGSATSLVKLRVTSCSVPAGNNDTSNQAPFPNLSNANNLKTIILDGCVGLEQVSHNALPPSLESFSFLNNVADATKISSISFRGCSKLKSMLLKGCLGRLEELDLSGTAVKTLDLREVEAPNLQRLILLGCEKLHAILWLPEDRRANILKVLRIDTNRSASISTQANRKEKTKEASVATRSSSIPVIVAAAIKPGISGAASFDFNWCISVRDARLLRSLVSVQEWRYNRVHMEIESSRASRVAIGCSQVAQGTRSLQQPNKYLDVRDVVFGGHLQAGVISWMLDCPLSPTPMTENWYVHIQDEDEKKSRLLQQQLTSMEGTSTSVALLPPKVICDCARTLHVHDSLSITTVDSFPRYSEWNNLEWCKVERCTKLHTVFHTPQRSGGIGSTCIFLRLQTFWASHLPALRYIWNMNAIVVEPDYHSFQRVVLLHLDYCPRLIHVFPLWSMSTFCRLETLEIVCCGDLREVFPWDPEHQEHQETTIEFPRLRRIHLHELPALQRICGPRMSTPKLETVKIRGCWSLKRLPAISRNTKPAPKVDCEKEWWNSLEWDGVKVYHHPSLYDYEASHQAYYKKAQLPRGTLLR